MRVLCFGDSNTWGYDPRSYFGGRYPAEDRWTDRLARETGWEVLNAGENGREIPRRAAEFRLVRDLLDRRAPDRLIVLLGSNDLLQGADVPAVAARMEVFLTALDFPMAHILLLAPPPMVPGAWVTEARLLTDSAALSGAYRALAARLGTAFADAGAWQVSLAFDGVHFTEAGHHAFAAGLADVARTWTP